MNENKDEDKNKFRGEAIVCFIDILGFSDDIKKNWDKPESDEHPLNKVLAIKQKAKDFEMSVKIESQNFPDKSDHIQITSISDSFVIRVSTNELSDYSKLIRIHLFLHVVSSLWVACIINGYTVRGAVSIGDVFWNDESIIGNTFIDVYKLESTVAKNSRVIISSDMNKELKRLFDVQENSVKKWQEFSSIWFDDVARFLRKDVDGYLILNPRFMLSLAKDNPIIDLLSDMKNKVADNIVKEKYTPLINMLKSENPAPLTASDFGHY